MDPVNCGCIMTADSNLVQAGSQEDQMILRSIMQIIHKNTIWLKEQFGVFHSKYCTVCTLTATNIGILVWRDTGQYHQQAGNGSVSMEICCRHNTTHKGCVRGSGYGSLNTTETQDTTTL